MLREKIFKQTIPKMKVEDGNEITYEVADAAMRRSMWTFGPPCSRHTAIGLQKMVVLRFKSLHWYYVLDN